MTVEVQSRNVRHEGKTFIMSEHQNTPRTIRTFKNVRKKIAVSKIEEK